MKITPKCPVFLSSVSTSMGSIILAKIARLTANSSFTCEMGPRMGPVAQFCRKSRTVVEQCLGNSDYYITIIVNEIIILFINIWVVRNSVPCGLESLLVKE